MFLHTVLEVASPTCAQISGSKNPLTGTLFAYYFNNETPTIPHKFYVNREPKCWLTV